MRLLAALLLVPSLLHAQGGGPRLDSIVQGPKVERRIQVPRELHFYSQDVIRWDTVTVEHTDTVTVTLPPDTVTVVTVDTVRLYCVAPFTSKHCTPNPPSSGGGTVGVPLGHFEEPLGTGRTGGDVVVPRAGNLAARLAAMKAEGRRVFVNVTGGTSSTKCALDAQGQLQFALWQACWNRNAAPVLGIIKAYADSGTILAIYLIDEPNLVKRWGTVAPETVKQMALYAKGQLPGVKVAARAAAAWLRKCDGVDIAWAQYAERRGPLPKWMADNLAAAKGAGCGLVFSLNGLNGGPENDDTPMTAQQILAYGTPLVEAGPCAFKVWEYLKDWSERADIRAALDSLGRVAARTPWTGCAPVK